MKSKGHVKPADGGRTRGIGADEPVIDPALVLSRLLRNSHRKQPLRLPNPHARGQGLQTVLSFDAPLDGEQGNELLEMIAAPEADLTVDWRAALRASKLTKLERKAIEQVQKGTPDYLFHKALKTSPKTAKRATQSAIAKVSKVAARHMSFRPIPDSLRLVFREYLPSAPGHRPATFSSIVLDPIFQETMAYEKYFALISQRDPGSHTKNRFSRVTVRRRFKLSPNGEVLEAEIKLEVFKLAHLRDWRSEESIRDMATDFVRKRNRDEAEAGERARIHGLGDSELDEADKTCLARIAVLRESIPADEKKLERLTKQLRERQSNSGTVAREEIVERLERNREDLGTENWRQGVIREEQAYRVRQVLEPEVFAALNTKEAKNSRKSNIEHMQSTRALIARHASNPAAVGRLAGLDHALGNAIAMLSWIDNIDPAGNMRGGI